MDNAETLVTQVISQFSQGSNDKSLLGFLRESRCPTKEFPVEGTGAIVLVSVVVGELVLIYDDVEEEFGIARLDSDLNIVNNIELIGSFSHSLQELKKRAS